MIAGTTVLRIAKWAVVSVVGLLICSAAGFAIWVWLATPRGKSGGIEASWPPAGSADAARFFALGDTGTGGDGQYRVAAGMEAVCNQVKGLEFDGILLLGDNFYPSGVGSTEDPQWQTKFEKPYGSPCLSKLPVYPVLGNHDYRLSPQAQIDYSLVQPRWRMPGRFYSVDFGDFLRMVAVDTNRFDWCGSPSNCVYDFMKSKLGASKAAWRLMIGHHPMISSSAHGRNYDGSVFKYTVRPEVCKRTDFYLSGHSHQLEHLRLEGCDADFLVAGSGGGDVGRLKDDRTGSKFVQSTHGFLTMEFSKDLAIVNFHDGDGRGLYRLERLRKL
jgi:tartrate-resistant acid phosphatase type 5